MDEFQRWQDNGWIKEGHFISYDSSGMRYFEYVKHRELIHYEYQWFEDVNAGSTSGPETPENDIVPTRPYDGSTKSNWIWQIIFGLKPQVFLYIELPGDTHLHGLPKIPKPSAAHRKVSHFEEWMSPYYEPTFLTEHFMMDGYGLNRITFEIYNPQPTAQRPWLNFLINSMHTERIGEASELDGKATAYKTRWQDAVTKLYAGTIPCRPLSLYGVRLPAAEK